MVYFQKLNRVEQDLFSTARNFCTNHIMSSDSDEDELLQMALKEQAQRDINYQKPSSKSSKPVVNLIQAPSPSAFEVNGKHQHKNPNHRMSSASSSNSKRGGGGGVDDEDSEVEMLSISSGDEDSSREIPIQQQKNRVRRPSRDDADQADDGGEPKTWKRVDEAEVNITFLI